MNTNWCTYCDSAITHMSDSLYCSESCLRSDALNHHPLLGYDYAELKDFPRSSCLTEETMSPPIPFKQKKDTDSISSSSVSSFESLSSFYQALKSKKELN
ncbi:hypothetical protein K501DRAFT_254551 [Backusella circina FSU 941]|nr:hypothetical protein K501DRAFT_254551 [Backusella circina FSU 941]